MNSFETLTGIVAPLDRVSVDTDAIIPKQFLTRIERSGFGKFLFYDWRFNEKGEKNPEFELTKDRYKEANILLARANFGCGSSREHAAWAIQDYGIKVIIAPSFADIFYNNCLKNSILPIQLPEDQVEELFKKTKKINGYKLTVNLVAEKVYDKHGFKTSFEINTYRKYCLLNGLDDIDISLKYEDKITEFEKDIHSYYLIK